ncbi:hypothetical protein [Methylobacterium sp. J-068]|uniref:hypothetical protein n=1 Tax=Methylobacterium sp. J-068 TaxID=2836649 RepID=UPI001FB8D60C|nr:hypothetical protein [Methylobacterium sp. J-068]MCJ2037225.1 hypothetical protein [Methylobacterium sp. J-068]
MPVTWGETPAEPVPSAAPLESCGAQAPALDLVAPSRSPATGARSDVGRSCERVFEAESSAARVARSPVLSVFSAPAFARRALAVSPALSWDAAVREVSLRCAAARLADERSSASFEPTGAVRADSAWSIVKVAAPVSRERAAAGVERRAAETSVSITEKVMRGLSPWRRRRKGRASQ